MAAAIKPVNWDAIEFETVTEMVSRREVAGGAQTLVQTFLRKGALVPLHVHEGDQWMLVQQGALAVTIAAERHTVAEGDVLFVPASTAHEVEALDDSLVIDVRSGRTSLM
jgi:quercetin dioxygenase-like cupin family protein